MAGVEKASLSGSSQTINPDGDPVYVGPMPAFVTENIRLEQVRRSDFIVRHPLQRLSHRIDPVAQVLQKLVAD